MYDILIYVLKAWTQKQDSNLRRWPLRCRRPTLVSVQWWYLLLSAATKLSLITYLNGIEFGEVVTIR